MVFAPPTRSTPAPDDASASSGASRLVRKTAVELVLDALRLRILSGALEPGSPLRQEALAEELGVSRIPLREAIRMLSSEGLVEVLPHKGAYVSMLSQDEVREFFELRLQLEPWLLAEAVPRIAGDALDRAGALVARMDAADAGAWGALNWQLHETLYAAAQRPTALAIVRGLHEKSERYFRFQALNAPIREQAHREHMALVELCRHGQADAAREALARHIADAAAQILAIVDRLAADEQAAAPGARAVG